MVSSFVCSFGSSFVSWRSCSLVGLFRLSFVCGSAGSSASGLGSSLAGWFGWMVARPVCRLISRSVHMLGGWFAFVVRFNVLLARPGAF